MTVEIENLIASRFIARPDVKAVQYDNGGYSPVRQYNPDTGRQDGPNIPWQRSDIAAHLSGEVTYGHYLVNTDDSCKLFAFDIDFQPTGALPEAYDIDAGGFHTFTDVDNLRAAWHDRSHFARTYMKTQLNLTAWRVASAVRELMSLDVACAYSGNKGVHVYAFLPKGSKAEQALAGGQIIMEELEYEPTKGGNFFVREDDQEGPHSNLSIEVFPKQESLAGKDLGNLMRLPLGVNRKNPDPTFFFDFTGPVNNLTPTDPVRALTPGNNPWSTGA